MRGKRYPQEQIIAILKEAEAGVPIPKFCRGSPLELKKLP